MTKRKRWVTKTRLLVACLVVTAVAAGGAAAVYTTVRPRCRTAFEVADGVQIADASSSVAASFNRSAPSATLLAAPVPVVFLDLAWIAQGETSAGCDLQLVVDAPLSWSLVGWTRSDAVTAGTSAIRESGLAGRVTRGSRLLDLVSTPGEYGSVRIAWAVGQPVGWGTTGPVRSHLMYGCVGWGCAVHTVDAHPKFV